MSVPSLITMEHFVYNEDTVSQEWPRFKRRFNIFLTISKLDVLKQEDAVLALNHLLHNGGDKILDIYCALDKPEEIVYKDFIAKLDARFITTNPKVARFRFRDCEQGNNESLLDYSQRLKSLGKLAGIVDNATLDENVLDVIMLKTKSADVRAKALEETTTLESLLKWKQGYDLRSNCDNEIAARHSTDFNVNAVNSKPFNRDNHSSFSRKQNLRAKPEHCFKCGQPWPHNNGPCPAIGKNCNKCGKLNHFEEVCQSGKLENIAAITTAQTQAVEVPLIQAMSQSELLLNFEKYCATLQLPNSVHYANQITEVLFNQMSMAQVQNCPRTYININGQRILHLVDTGSSLNIISERSYLRMKRRPEILPTKTVAFGYHSRVKVPLIGEFTTIIMHKGVNLEARYLVLNGKADDIIGYPTAKAMGIVQVDLDTEQNNAITTTDRCNANPTTHLRSKHPNFHDQSTRPARYENKSLLQSTLGSSYASEQNTVEQNKLPITDTIGHHPMTEITADKKADTKTKKGASTQLTNIYATSSLISTKPPHSDTGGT
jgi:hypothetical protein